LTALPSPPLLLLLAVVMVMVVPYGCYSRRHAAPQPKAASSSLWWPLASPLIARATSRVHRLEPNLPHNGRIARPLTHQQHCCQKRVTMLENFFKVKNLENQENVQEIKKR